ncbi:uncharacterized protein [Diadema setosum]|uniref:uncharacterized protein n=1 Tax=Diadema setosum TaxID=31175 RepID=UPI003B3A2406
MAKSVRWSFDTSPVKSESMVRAASVRTFAREKRAYSRWAESFDVDSSPDSDLTDGSDDLEGDGAPSRARSLKKGKKTKSRKSIVQVARTGQLADLKALLDGLDDDEIESEINEHDGKNYSALHYAADKDDVEMVRLLVHRGADVNDIGEASRRPLHFAAGATRKERDLAKSEDGRSFSKRRKLLAKKQVDKKDSVVCTLMASSADVNVEDCRGRTPLFVAAWQGNVEAASHLLSSKETDIESEDHSGTTALLAACFYGKTDVAIMLINKGAKLNVWDDNFDTPLHIVFREGNKKIALRIIEKAKQNGSLYELLTKTNGNNNPPIHEAVRKGHKDLVQLALEHVKPGKRDEMESDDELKDDSDEDGKDMLNFAGEIENTPLHEACTTGHLEMVKMLCVKGAKINVQNWDGFTPLHFACATNHQRVAEYLIEKGADHHLPNHQGLTPLQTAAISKSFDTLVALLEILRNVDTSRNARDSLETAAQLIRWAAEENKADTLQLLLHHGRKVHGMNDDAISDLIHGASKKGYTETILALIHWKREVVDHRDAAGNTPLHHAAEAGRDATVQELIKAKAMVNIPNCGIVNKRTPIHHAAANGWIRTVKLLIKAEAVINVVDSLKLTPLHLACKNGHTDMVKLLVYNELADILLRDKNGLNCLDHAIDNGHEDIVNLLVSHDNWREVMSVCSSDQETGERTTPMRKLIKTMPDVAERILDLCVQHNPEAGPNDANYWVEFYYELLEDSFSQWQKPKDSDGKDKGGKANGINNNRDRKDQMASKTDFDIKRSVWASLRNILADTNLMPAMTNPYDAGGHLRKDATPYTKKAAEIAANHPLNIMVSAQRTRLLAHPLVSNLLSHKLRRVGWPFFLGSLLFYLIFVFMLTGYIIVVPPTYYFPDVTSNDTWLQNGTERWVAAFPGKTLPFFGKTGFIIIIILVILNVIRELIQLRLQRLSYLTLGNAMEWTLYLLALLLVLPLNKTDFHSGITVRLAWQWQCGALAVFLAWINLILFIRRVPLLGIYVIMFLDIVRSFLKFLPILLLFLAAFTLAFYALLMNQEPFHRVEYSLAKTIVMMVGELDFSDIFHSQNYLNTENTLADGREDYFLTFVFYRRTTYIMLTVFLVVMSILMMNLLVGLAVDDIHAIQEKAKLHRLKMQVEMVLEVQQTLPICIWRRAVIQRQRVYINKGRLMAKLRKWRSVFNWIMRDLVKASRICSKKDASGDFMQETVTADQLLTSMKYRLKKIDNKVETIAGCVNGAVADELSKVRSEQKKLENRFDRMEKKMDSLLERSEVGSVGGTSF